MAKEYSTGEIILLNELKNRLTLTGVVKDGDKPIPLNEWNQNHKAQLAVPQGLKPGEVAVVQQTPLTEAILTVVDKAWGRPVRRIILKLGFPDRVGMVPRQITAISYDLDLDLHYPVIQYEGLPLRVARQTSETWDCTPRGKKTSRVALSVNRAIYEPADPNVLFTPYRFVSSSDFVLSPADYGNPYGETGQQFWVEQQRTFEYLGRKINYRLASDGNLILTQGGGIANKVLEKIKPDIRLLSQK